MNQAGVRYVLVVYREAHHTHDVYTAKKNLRTPPLHAYDYRVKKPKISASRRRTVQWGKDVDALAVTLAADRGYYPEKINGGVSQLLADLVLKANKPKICK
jgi:hypothetical protein